MRYIILTLVFNYFSLPFLMGFAIPPEKAIHHDTYPITKHAYRTMVADTVQILVEEGWNLVSLPLIVPDNQVSVLFPNSVSNAFYYDGSYRPSDTLEVGKGYWLKFSAAETILVVGTSSAWTNSLFPGWNMIGGLDYAVDINQLYTLSEGKLISGFYAYDSGQYHQVTDSLLPGIGYWIKVSDSCSVYPNYGHSGRARLQNEIEHSGIFVRLLELDTTIATMTDSLGYFMFDSLPDGNWTLRASYAYYFPQQFPVKVIGGNLTIEIDVELQQIFQFWSEPAETTVSLQDNFCIRPRVSVVNLLNDTVHTTSEEDFGYSHCGVIRTPNWPSDSCYFEFWKYYNSGDWELEQRWFIPGDTLHFTQLFKICRGDVDSGECFKGNPMGIYQFFSGVPNATVYPWFLNRKYVLETGPYYRPLYKSLNHSLSKKMKLFRPTIINIIN